jgi:hypothetical protein
MNKARTILNAVLWLASVGLVCWTYGSYIVGSSSLLALVNISVGLAVCYLCITAIMSGFLGVAVTHLYVRFVEPRVLGTKKVEKNQ